MEFSVPRPDRAVLSLKFFASRTVKQRCLLLLGMLLASPILRAQQTGDATVVDKQTLQLLLQRVAELEARVKTMDQLEARIKELEAAKSPTGPAPATGVASVSAQSGSTPENEPEAMTDHSMSERMDVSKTLLRVRGFGDITLHGDDQKGDHTS